MTEPTSDQLDSSVDLPAAPDLLPPDLTPDLPPADTVMPDLEIDAAICSAAGVATDCDPFELTGCTVGSCYVVRNQGPACVCPIGILAERAACNTTAECVPGLVCAGDEPPGVCRRVCDPDRPRCPGKYVACMQITGLTDYGFCLPYYR